MFIKNNLLKIVFFEIKKLLQISKL